MKKIIVEAFEDPSRPQGGHAVILLRGVDHMPERPSIRLRPIEVGAAGEVRGLWRGARIEPVATRATPHGIELVVGPDIVGHPQLVAGTPVIIEVPEADVRGEFLWPGVAPLAAPRRRHVVVPRHPRAVIAPPAPANDDTAQYTADDARPLTATDGNLALTAELAPGALPQPAPQAEHVEAAADAAATVPPAAAAAEAPAISHDDAAPPRPATAADGAASDAGTRALDHDLPARTTIDPSWTPGRREGLLQNGLLAAVCGAFLLLALAYWGLSGRRASAPDAAALSDAGRASAGEGAIGAGGPSNGGPGSGSAAKGGQGPKAAAAGTAAVVAKPAACDAPAIATEPLPAGHMRLTIKAPCKGAETVRIAYGGAETVLRLDDKGALATSIDCFAGAADPLEVRFTDGTRHVVPIKAGELDRVSKIAVVWKAPVNLDLHAFEYAALPGSKGDIWAGAPGTASAAARAVSAERRGHGFISSSADGLGPGDHIEVYTFLHADDQTSGSVGLAIDHETRGDRPTDTTCGAGALAVIPYDFVLLSRGGKARHERGIIGAAECGSVLGPDVRFNQSALPVLRIKK